MLDAGDVEVAARLAAGGDQDVFGGDRAVLGEQVDGVGVAEHGAAVNDLGAGLLQVADVDAAQPGDVARDVVDQRRPVEVEPFGAPAKTDGILELLGVVGGVDEQLLRHATAQHAGTADAVLLGDRHPLAEFGGKARRANAGRTGADDEQIVVVAWHRMPQRSWPIFFRSAVTMS